MIMVAGCGLLGKNSGTYGKASAQEDKQKAKVEQIDQSMSKNNAAKLELIGQYAYGVGYSLSKYDTYTNVSVQVADDLNTRIVSLSPNPSIEEIEEMRTLVNMLLTNNAKATKLLKQKDDDIAALQNEQKVLLSEKDKEIKKYMDLANATAGKADQYKATLAEMDSFWGGSAIWYGLKKLFTKLAWTLGICGVLFIVLRFASMSNPLAASIFSIFSRMGSWVINTVEFLLPKALEKAGQVSKAVYDKSRGILTKIVDNVQNLKQLETRLGHDLTVKELLTELEKSLDVNEKDEIAVIKKELGYN